MADEIKPQTDAEIQAKANADAAEIYKGAVGGTFTNGTKKATIKSYTPSRLTGGQARQCFLVNYGHPNCSFFVPCKEFMEEFKPVSDDAPAVTSTSTNLPH